jgi:hypothetical protein
MRHSVISIVKTGQLSKLNFGFPKSYLFLLNKNKREREREVEKLKKKKARRQATWLARTIKE